LLVGNLTFNQGVDFKQQQLSPGLLKTKYCLIIVACGFNGLLLAKEAAADTLYVRIKCQDFGVAMKLA